MFGVTANSPCLCELGCLFPSGEMQPIWKTGKQKKKKKKEERKKATHRASSCHHKFTRGSIHSILGQPLWQKKKHLLLKIFTKETSYILWLGDYWEGWYNYASSAWMEQSTELWLICNSNKTKSKLINGESQCQALAKKHNNPSCVCVCVWEEEREKERESVLANHTMLFRTWWNTPVGLKQLSQGAIQHIWEEYTRTHMAMQKQVKT